MGLISHAFTIVKTPTNKWDSTNPTGSGGTTGVWVTVPDQTGKLQGTSYSLDLDTLYTKPGGAASVIYTLASGSLSGGWSISTHFLNYDGTGGLASTSISILATPNTGAASVSNIFQVESLTPNPTNPDTVAPPIPVRLAIGVDTNTVTFTCDRVWDARITGVIAKGMKRIQLMRAGAARATYTYPAAGEAYQLTGVDLGTVGTAGSTAQSGNQYTNTASGASALGSTDNGRYSYVAVGSGDFLISGKVASTANTVSGTTAALMFRGALANNSKMFAVFGTVSGIIRGRARLQDAGGASAGTSLTGSITSYYRLSRTGINIKGEISTDGVSYSEVWNQDMDAGPGYIGTFECGAQSPAATVVWQNVNIVTSDITIVTLTETSVPNGTHSYTVISEDLDSNRSADSSALSAAVSVAAPTGNLKFSAGFETLGVNSETNGPTYQALTVPPYDTAHGVNPTLGHYATPYSWDPGNAFQLGRQPAIVADPFGAGLLGNCSRHRIEYNQLAAGISPNFPGVDMGPVPRQTGADLNHGLRCEQKAMLGEEGFTYDAKDWWWGFAFGFISLTARTGGVTAFCINQGHFIPQTIGGFLMKPNQPPFALYVTPDSSATPLLSLSNKYTVENPDAPADQGGTKGEEISDLGVTTFLDGTPLRFTVGQWNYMIVRANWSGNRGVSGSSACAGAILQGWLNGKQFVNKLNKRNCYYQTRVPYIKNGLYYANWKFNVPTGNARYVEMFVRRLRVSVDGTGSYDLVNPPGGPGQQ